MGHSSNMAICRYGIFNAFGEMGPGVATFLCGAESFPTPLRGHFLGLAAAVGKAGAAIGTEVSAYGHCEWMRSY